MYRRLAVAAISLILAVSAHAALAADASADYVFGTSLVLTSPKQLMDPNNANGWWADLLPTTYNYSVGTLVDAVNAARQARGEKEMVDVKTYPVNIGSETEKNGKYEYNIDFQHMTPADVDVILAKFPMAGKLAGLPHEVRPIRIGYFNADSTDANASSLTLHMLGQDIAVTQSDSFGATREKITALLAQHFGTRAKFDLSISRYLSATGSGDSYNVSVTVYLDGAETQQGGEVGE